MNENILIALKPIQERLDIIHANSQNDIATSELEHKTWITSNVDAFEGLSENLDHSKSSNTIEQIISRLKGLRPRVNSLDNNLETKKYLNFELRCYYNMLIGYYNYYCQTDEAQKQAASIPSIRLKWNGQKNALIDLFYQLKRIYPKGKNDPLLSCSNEDLASFLQTSFQCFEDTKLSTISGLLKKSDRPKKSEMRVSIDCQ